MREIRFKAWDSENEIFGEVDEVHGDFEFIKDGDRVRSDLNLQVILNRDFPEIIALQFTGLYDKNGKHIYEGDIIRSPRDRSYHFGEVGKIIYLEDKAGFLVEGKWSRNQYQDALDCDIAIESEIIGNVYQNPELLTNV